MIVRRMCSSAVDTLGVFGLLWTVLTKFGKGLLRPLTNPSAQQASASNHRPFGFRPEQEQQYAGEAESVPAVGERRHDRLSYQQRQGEPKGREMVAFPPRPAQRARHCGGCTVARTRARGTCGIQMQATAGVLMNQVTRSRMKK